MPTEAIGEEVDAATAEVLRRLSEMRGRLDDLERLVRARR
jgi:hypothetical protein